MEAASEAGVNLKQGYNGGIISREAGSVGGQMVNMMGKNNNGASPAQTCVNAGIARCFT